MSKRAVIVNGYFPITGGGAEYQAYLLAKQLNGLYQISFIYIDNPKEGYIRQQDGYTLMSIPKHHLTRKICCNCFVCDYGQMESLFKYIKPDLIYQRGGSAHTGIVARYANKNGCRSIWHIASERDVQANWYRSTRTALFDYIDKKVLEYGIHHVDRIIGQAHYQDHLLYQNYGRRCDLIVGNWHPLPKENINKQLPITIVWIANVKSIKRPEIFIAMAAELAYLPDTRFVMVGKPPTGSLKKRFERELSALGNIEFKGELSSDNVNCVLATSHILINTSLYEGYPNTFIEAWMRAVPVVSLNVDPDDVLVKRGIGFHSGSYANLVRDTKRLILDKELRKNMGEEARRYAIQNHALETGSTKVIEMMKALC